MKSALIEFLNRIISDWYQTLPEVAAYPVLIMASVICGAVIGVEREKK